MRNIVVRQSIVVLWMILMIASCKPSIWHEPIQLSEAKNSILSNPLATPFPPEKRKIVDSSIRRIDFNRISYPNYPNNETGELVTLKAGDGAPSHVSYGDVTNDAAEEAIVVLPVDTGKGTAIVYRVYIFTRSKGKLKLIWDFDTGDRADGGVRAVYDDNGSLVIELYGKNRIVGGELYVGDEGLCCPSSFTRTRYRWTGKSYEQTSTEILRNPEGNAVVLMPRYAAQD